MRIYSSYNSTIIEYNVPRTSFENRDDMWQYTITWRGRTWHTFRQKIENLVGMSTKLRRIDDKTLHTVHSIPVQDNVFIFLKYVAIYPDGAAQC